MESSLPILNKKIGINHLIQFEAENRVEPRRFNSNLLSNLIAPNLSGK
jgi:hypothetical protein